MALEALGSTFIVREHNHDLLKRIVCQFTIKILYANTGV